MVMPNEEELEEGRVEITPTYQVVPEPVVPEPEEKPKSELPMTALTDEDRAALFGVGGLADISKPEDLSDLVEVGEDLFSLDEPEPEPEPQPKPTPKRVLYRRTQRPYTPPETGMGGVRS